MSKRPRKLKFPKRPKANANSAIWDRYHAKCKVIAQRNDQKMKPYLAEIKRRKAIIKSVDALKVSEVNKNQKEVIEAQK